MKFLGHEGILPKVLDPFTPPECQYTEEWDIWEKYKCDKCGEVYEDEPEKCAKCGFDEFSPIEVFEET